ncbi:MAG: hypothetical protein F6K03_02365 [Kamptonema sp. SIO4C4]|nr:hypothetical protein [Kamptonema sp. SIO4C4]
MRIGGRDIIIDWAVETAIAAERDAEKIAVEIKTFLVDAKISKYGNSSFIDCVKKAKYKRPFAGYVVSCSR